MSNTTMKQFVEQHVWYDAMWVSLAIAARLHHEQFRPDQVQILPADLRYIDAWAQNLKAHLNEKEKLPIIVSPHLENDHFTSVVVQPAWNNGALALTVYYENSSGKVNPPDALLTRLREVFGSNAITIETFPAKQRNNGNDCGAHTVASCVSIARDLVHQREPTPEYIGQAEMAQRRMEDYQCVANTVRALSSPVKDLFVDKQSAEAQSLAAQSEFPVDVGPISSSSKDTLVGGSAVDGNNRNTTLTRGDLDAILEAFGDPVATLLVKQIVNDVLSTSVREKMVSLEAAFLVAAELILKPRLVQAGLEARVLKNYFGDEVDAITALNTVKSAHVMFNKSQPQVPPSSVATPR